MVNQVHPNTHYQIHILWSGCGGEYTGKFLKEFLKKKLIQHQMITLYTLEQNEKVEWDN
jgi:hypothetical protein